MAGPTRLISPISTSSPTFTDTLRTTSLLPTTTSSASLPWAQQSVELPPKQLSDIITLALAKDPEDRYQSLDTLAYDLRKLSQICRANGDLTKFAVGEVDHMSRFSLPATVIERGAELEALDVAFAAVANGNASSRVINIWGQSGNGKSRLVDEWAGKLEADDFGAKCLVGHAKPDEHIRKPLTSFVQIFQSLLDRVLTDPREDGKEWLDRIKTALAGRWPFFVSLLSVESRRLLNEEDSVSLTLKIEVSPHTIPTPHSVADIRERSSSRHSNRGHGSSCSCLRPSCDHWCSSLTTPSGCHRTRWTCESP